MQFSLSLIFTKRFWIALIILIAISLFLVLRSTTAQVLLETLTPPTLPDREAPETRLTLDQNWTPDVSERFHFISQGTSTLPIPYDWLIALEEPVASPWALLLPGTKPLFKDPENMERYGFIPREPSVSNPDGLPIGFAQTPFQNLAGYPTTTTTVGFTCAACHTRRLAVDGTEYLIEGGPAFTDLQTFSKGLGASIGQTLIAAKLPLPNQRFDRFARRVLGDTYSAATKAQLAKDLESIAAVSAKTGDIIDVVEGYGRLDALNRIGNQVFSKNTGHRDNYTPINAPVNYPHIWTASWFDWVQYDGSIMQPLVRNAGEALGVHTPVNLTAPIGQGRFSSSIPIEDLVWIERTIGGNKHPLEDKAFGGLQAPAWPDAFGTIDTALAEEGEALYNRHCAGCHLPPVTSETLFTDQYFKPITWDRFGGSETTEDSYLTLKILPQRVIGTDPAQGDILAQRTVNTAADVATGREALGIDVTVCGVQPQYSGPSGTRSGLDTTVTELSRAGENTLGPVQVQDGPSISFAMALGALVQQVNVEAMNARRIPTALRPPFEGDRPNCLQAGAGYKARPLNGIWATAPFLHNGSVPTLDDLLRPADQRPPFVRLGSWEFDPVKVGLAQPELSDDSYPAYTRDGYFIMDTSIVGNLNTGHAFGATASGDRTGVIGPQFTDTQRAALIEYIKSL